MITTGDISYKDIIHKKLVGVTAFIARFLFLFIVGYRGIFRGTEYRHTQER